ncbi:MAG: hypothetical protein U0414_40120 [Polyangiaceae bacterium]
MSDPYRDEVSGLRLRVEELESELRAARARILELEGTGPAPRSFGERLVGAPLSIEHELTLDRELDSTDHEEIVEIARRRIGGMVQPSAIGKGLHCVIGNAQSARFVEISARAKDGRTVVRVTERLGGLAGGLFGGIVGGVGGGGMGGIVPLVMALHLGALAPLLAISWIALVYVVVRLGFQRAVAARARTLAGLVRDVALACDRPRARVAIAPETNTRASRRQADAQDSADVASEPESEADAEEDLHADPARRPALTRGWP